MTVGEAKEEVFLCCKGCLKGKINPGALGHDSRQHRQSTGQMSNHEKGIAGGRQVDSGER